MQTLAFRFVLLLGDVLPDLLSAFEQSVNERAKSLLLLPHLLGVFHAELDRVVLRVPHVDVETGLLLPFEDRLTNQKVNDELCAAELATQVKILIHNCVPNPLINRGFELLLFHFDFGVFRPQTFGVEEYLHGQEFAIEQQNQKVSPLPHIRLQSPHLHLDFYDAGRKAGRLFKEMQHRARFSDKL